MIDRELPFGEWLKRRRKELDLTQRDLARCVSCAVITLRKIEAEERRPSRQIAELMATALEIPAGERAAFISAARAPQGRRTLPLHAAARLASQRLTNLPSPATRLIGRDRDAAQLRERVLDEGCRLLTLVGAPGVGKTRLAVHVAEGLVADFGEGVWFVELASVRDPDLVPSAIAQTLRVNETATQNFEQRLKAYLRDMHLLLVLDNFEQVMGAASFVAGLLAACPWLSFLVTSRAPLRIRGERQYRLAPLASPREAADAGDLAHLSAYSAVELFLERGQASAPDFSLTRENAEPVAALCRKLDGLPLAIELVAPSVAVLPPEELLRRLNLDLLLHADGLRDAAPRHRSLGDAIGWSYALLTPHAQDLLRRCAVCVEGWTLEVAEALTEGEPASALAALTSLTEANLVVRRAQARDVRFVMLETIHAFALERLAQCGNEMTVRQRHAEHYLAFAVEANRHLRTAGQLPWLQRLETERGNLRAALGWFLEGDGAAADGVRLAAALVWFWLMRSRLSEAWEWLTKALAHRHTVQPEQRAAVATVLMGLGAVAWQRGDLATARGLIEESIGCYEECAPTQRGDVAWALTGLAMVAAFQVDMETARAAADESLVQAQLSGDPWLVGLALNPVAEVSMLRHDYATARALLDRSLALFRQVDDKWAIALPLLNKGYLDATLGDTLAARKQLEEAIALCRELDEMDTRYRGLAILAGVAQQEGNLVEATELYQESLDLLRRMGLDAECAETLYNLGRLVDAQGHGRLAAKLFGDCMALYERQGNHEGIARCRERLANQSARG